MKSESRLDWVDKAGASRKLGKNFYEHPVPLKHIDEKCNHFCAYRMDAGRAASAQLNITPCRDGLVPCISTIKVK